VRVLAVQYLEGGPGVGAISPDDARARLRTALERLPVSIVIVGWNLPSALLAVCQQEAGRAGAQLFRWHPLLTGDGVFVPRPEWQTVGVDGERVPGFRGRPEFTFVCPNQPAVREAALSHLRDVLRGGAYQGVFLDRIRYPSPAAAPDRLLACFCDDCRRVAAAERLDLGEVRRGVGAVLTRPQRALSFVRALLDPQAQGAPERDLAALRAFLDLRARSVTRFVRAVAGLIHGAGLAVGLDCFSPAIARLVGQDLTALHRHAEWVKIMTYGHALGPAGLPFELLDLANWMVSRRSVSEADALTGLSLATGLPLPATRAELRQRGLAPEALAIETRRARAAGVTPLFAGVELVEIEGVVRLDQRQIVADLHAFRQAGADGLVLSWDLWHIPPERLDLVRVMVSGGRGG